MKIKTLISLIILVSFTSYSQDKQYFDYIVTQENDTIYGTFREKLFKNVFLEPKTNTQGEITFNTHSIKYIKAYRYNDFINVVKKSEDGIYDKLQNAQSLKDSVHENKSDYIVQANGDTIVGNINFSLLAFKEIIKTPDGKKIKIKFPQVTSYSKDNFIFKYKEKGKINYTDKKGDYLLELHTGKINLYGYYFNHQKKYYLEKEGKLYLLESWDNIIAVLGDDKELVNLIVREVYSFENIYLMVKFYCRPEHI